MSKEKQVIYEVSVLYKISSAKQADFFFLLTFVKCSKFLAFKKKINGYISALQKTWKILKKEKNSPFILC